MVELLIQNGANVNEKNIYDVTPLMMAACTEGYAKTLLKYIINNKANINEKDNEKYTALIIALNYGHKEIVELLLKNSADTSNCDLTGIKYLFNFKFFKKSLNG